jgi:prophage regulatory protein
MSPTTPAEQMSRAPRQTRGWQQEPDRILRWHEVRDRVGLSRTTIWRMVRRGDFPAPVPLAERHVGWLSHEIDQWIAERASRRPSTEA